MKHKSKAGRLVQLLSEEEALLFCKEAVLQTRSSLQTLFNQLRNGSDEDSASAKATLFKATFGKTYTKAKDYLLRNELRLLTTALQRFVSIRQMVAQAADDENLQQRFYIEWLAQKNVWDWEERESLQVVEHCLAKGDYPTAVAVLKQYTERFIFYKEATPAHYTRLLTLQHQLIHTATIAHRHLLAEVEMKQAFAGSTLRAIKPGAALPQAKHPHTTDAFQQFATHIVTAYSQQGVQKVSTLKKALLLCARIRKKGFEYKDTTSSIAALIALEYFLLEQYHKAIPFHRKALHFTEGMQPERIISYVFNYLSTMLRMENYLHAIELINQYEPVWRNIPRMTDRFLCLRAMSHIFLRQPDAAWNCIPHNRKQSGLDHYYYFRFVQIAIYIQKEEYHLAIAETETFIHTIRNNDKDAAYLKLMLTIKRYLGLRLQRKVLPVANYRQKCSKLLQAHTTQQQAVQLPEHSLLYRWLHEILQHELR